MDVPRTLPPLVRGKLMGVLDFYIDEIIICRNDFCVTKNIDITAQVLWWGEILPACIRPKRLKVEDKISSNSQTVKPYFHSVQYEVRTTADLLKSYLKACEVLELSIYEGVKNCVMGSSFLTNLCNLLNKNNEFILMPIIDYSGEEIGQIKFHIDFVKCPQNDKNHDVCENETIKGSLDLLKNRILKFLRSDYIFPAEKTLFYDGHSKATNFEVKSDRNSEFDESSLKNSISAFNLVLSKYKSDINLESDLRNKAEDSHECIIFPEVCVSKDSSKILNFDISSNPIKIEKITESKLPYKFSSSLIKTKANSKNENFNVGISSNVKKFVKKTVTKDQVIKKPLTKTNQVLPKKQSTESLCNKDLNLDSISQTCDKSIVFDYLLGSAMSKENEENALKGFKEMSPSYDVVCSINELCLTSDKAKDCHNKCIKHNLCFDLSNPIERNYYEKFFVKNNFNDFDVAELLNEPDNSNALQASKANDKNNQKNGSEIESNFVYNIVKKKNDNFLYNIGRENKIASGCARCKYYKKLDELDTIIESLKHFEKNMLKQEKSLQLGFGLNLSKPGS